MSESYGSKGHVASSVNLSAHGYKSKSPLPLPLGQDGRFLTPRKSPSLSPERSPTPRRSRSKTPPRRSSSRSRSRSSRRKSKGKRRHRRRRSSESDRSSSTLNIQQLISESLAKNLQPIKDQLSKLNGEASNPVISSELSDLKKQQQQLQIETKANTLSSSGAQSQYRAFASISVKIQNATEALDDLLLTKASPDDDDYKSIHAVKEMIQSAASEAEERISLIFKADSIPKHGWKALTVFEEKKRLQSNKETSAETDKAFASCVKQVQEEQKKSKPTSSASSSSSRPFRSRPGVQSGSSAGDVDIQEEREREI